MHTYVRTYIHPAIHAYIHTYIHADTYTYIHTYIQTYRHTDIQTYRHTYRHTDIQTYKHTNIAQHLYVTCISHSYYIIYEKDTCQSCPMIAHCLQKLPSTLFRSLKKFEHFFVSACRCFSKLFQLEAQGWNLALFFQPAGWSESDLWHERTCFLMAPWHLDTFGLFMKATSIPASS